MHSNFQIVKVYASNATGKVTCIGTPSVTFIIGPDAENLLFVALSVCNVLVAFGIGSFETMVLHKIQVVS